MNRTRDLRPCPFCGGSAWMEEIRSNMWAFRHDVHGGCLLIDTDIQDLAVFSDELEEFIEAWERREDDA